MDDYSLTSLTESKNEWCARLVGILTHHVLIGIESILRILHSNETSNGPSFLKKGLDIIAFIKAN